MNNFLWSVRTPQEAIEFYKNAQILLSKIGLNLRERTKSDEENTDPRGRRVNKNCYFLRQNLNHPQPLD